MSRPSFSPAERLAAIGWAREDLYSFSRWMFMQRKGFMWRRAMHHALICNALMRVFRGECKRLIINMPPRYSKTELAVVNFIAWAFGKVPDAEFIHCSYSTPLAVNNSTQVRGLVQHEAYAEIFPVLHLATDAGSHWKTTAGGVMYATGTGGTITGFGAGKHRDGFGGCFPVGTRVWTDQGLLPIDRIVRERMSVQAWAFDYAGRMELRPVIDWHENPPNDIVRVTFSDGATVECTPDHRFWTLNRGWVRADSLSEEDLLPCVNSGVQGPDNVGIDAQGRSGGLDPEPILAPGSVAAIGQGGVGLGLSQDSAQVGCTATLLDDAASAGDGLPCVAAPDLLYHGSGYTELRGQRLGGFADGVVDGERLLVGEDGNGVNLSLAECPVLLAVNDIRGAGVVAQVGEPVVSTVSVCMANVCPARPGPDECPHDQHMHADVLDCAPLRQADATISMPIIGEFEDSLWNHVRGAGAGDGAALASDAAKVADTVRPFISGHRKPTLIEHVRHDDVTFCLTVDEYHNFTVESGLVVKNCIIIDDPHKADEATSDTIRKGVLDWFQNTLESRKNSPDTPIIVIMQRLHEDDLAGWLLGDRGKDGNGPPVPGGNGEVWEQLRLSAWVGDDEAPLWPEKHSAEELRRMEKANPYVFAGQYRQLPAPPSGGVIKPDMMPIVDAIPGTVVEWCRGWDLGASGDGDYTAGAKVGRLADGRYIIADMKREQFETNMRDQLIKNTAVTDGRMLKQSLPQDPGQAGKSQVQAFAKLLAGHNVHFSPETGGKVTRATPLASQINAGNVLLLKASWNTPFIDECRLFPFGKYDDQVDGAARGFNGLLQPTVGIFT